MNSLLASEKNVTNYLTKLTFSPVGMKFSLNPEQPQTAKVTLFNWCYRFRDGSRLVGQLKGQLDKDRKTLLNPTQIRADYLNKDGKTVMQSWRSQDFVAFDLNIEGNAPLIVASNDNFVANSLCLVNSKSRTCAQVTAQGMQLIGEAFEPESWSLTPQLSSVSAPESSMTFDWAFSPSFPFVCVNVDVGFSHLKTSYNWTFFPYLPFYPFMRVVRTTLS